MIRRTSLSAGLIIKGMLAAAGVEHRAFPVATQKADLPYIEYHRTASKANPAKGIASADAATMQVTVWSETVIEGVEIAEAVREALDGKALADGDLVCRRCLMTDSAEGWDADAYFQRMVFEMAIGR